MLNPWLALNLAVSLAVLVGLVRLRRAQRRHQREVQIKLATLATRLEQARRADATLATGLTPAEELALTAVLATVAIRPEFLAIPGDECQDYAADGDGSQDSTCATSSPPTSRTITGHDRTRGCSNGRRCPAPRVPAPVRSDGGMCSAG